MTARLEKPLEDIAPPLSYRLLSEEELVRFEGDLGVHHCFAPGSSSLMVVNVGRAGVTLYPAFQFDRRLDEVVFARARALFAASSLSEQSLWNSLRTRHTSLGGLTGIDFLLGYFHPDVAAMTDVERGEVFEEVLREEVWRAQQ